MDLRKIDKKLLIKLLIPIALIIAVVIIVVIIKLLMGNRIEYAKIEDRMIKAAEKYYNANSEKLPTQNNGSVSINVEELVSGGYMKELSKLTKDKEASCSGNVTVYKTGENHYYIPELNCGEYYKTTYLKDVLLKEGNVVTSSDGLYNINGNYVYRGEKVNNYAKYAGKDWLILRVNNDGTIRMVELTEREHVVWDNRYNIESSFSSGINNYSLSRIRDSITEIYENEFSNEDKKYLVSQNMCIGGRKKTETINDGSIECSKTLENQMLSLPQVNEYLLASIDPNCSKITDSQCSNYNYFTRINTEFWSITIDADTTSKVYRMSPIPYLTDAANTSRIKVVVHINSKVRYVSGDGTKEKPYVFE